MASGVAPPMATNAAAVMPITAPSIVAPRLSGSVGR